MVDDPSQRDAKAKSDKPRLPSQPHKGSDKSGTEADEITPYRDRPSDDGKHGDAADEPATGSPNAAPEPDRDKGH